MTAEKHQSTECLRLRRRADLPLARQMGEKRVDLIGSHGSGMAFSMKENETLRPAVVRLLGAATVVARPYGGANPIEKTRRLGHRPRLPRSRQSVKVRYEGWTDGAMS